MPAAVVRITFKKRVLGCTDTIWYIESEYRRVSVPLSEGCATFRMSEVMSDRL
jgi:hypothetical protein